MSRRSFPLAKVDKFKRFGLTAQAASLVQAPLIKECFANLEFRVVDTALRKHKTIHHMGYGKSMVGGETIKLRSRMR